MEARIGTMSFDDLNNLVIEGVLCEELTPEDAAWLEKFTRIELWAFNDNRLKSLINLPRSDTLLKIEMCYNRIKTGLEAFQIYKQLINLKLRGNRIDSFVEVGKLKLCPLLIDLDLSSNPVQQQNDYRDIVFGKLEGLEYLDTIAKEDFARLSNGDSCEFNPNVEPEDEEDNRDVK